MLLSNEETIVKEGVGVLVARFQVSNLTEGHQDIIQSVIDRHQKTICVLGLSAIKCSKNNPLDFEIRRKMISKMFPEVQICYIDDNHSDNKWSKKLDTIIRKNTPPGSKVLLYGSRDSFKSHYSGSYKVIELVQESYTSGTQNRTNASFRAGNSEDFMLGAIWATQNQYDTSYAAVDIAIIDSKRNILLLGRKEGEHQFRFVGGFCEPSTEAQDGNFLEKNAMREAIEETKLELDQLKYVGSFSINDWRYRNEKDKIFSTLFTAEYMFGKPEASDDIDELKWFDLNTITPKDVVTEHRPMLKVLLNSLKRQETK